MSISLSFDRTGSLVAKLTLVFDESLSLVVRVELFINSCVGKVYFTCL